MVTDLQICGPNDIKTSNKDDQCKTTAEQLGIETAKLIIKMFQDPKYNNFFTYMNILVEWVNANPQLLNKEELKDPGFLSAYPKIDESYQLFDWANPYKSITRLRTLSCGLETLKSSIANETAGYNPSTIISNVANTPLGITSQFNRIRFSSSFPVTSYSNMMMRGGNENVEEELKKVSELYGYKLFNDIYQNILQMMGSFGTSKGCPSRKKIKFSDRTKNSIQAALEGLKEAEQNAIKSISNLVERNKLYQASNGYIDAYNIPEENLPAILAKQSNLLKAGYNFNKKASNIIDVFQTSIAALISKMNELEKIQGNISIKFEPSNTSAVNRAITTDYPII